MKILRLKSIITENVCISSSTADFNWQKEIRNFEKVDKNYADREKDIEDKLLDPQRNLEYH